MDDAEQTLVKRGLFRLGTATASELASFSETGEDAVAGYLATRADLVLAHGPAGPWTLRPESRESLMAEILAGIERDPERLSDVLQPGFLDRVRSSLGMVEAILDDAGSDGLDPRLMLPGRLAMMGRALGEMRRHGRDVSAEDRRLQACRARLPASGASVAREG